MRYINFKIAGEPDVLVHMEEQEDGSILVRLDVGEGGLPGDIRGLFFDVADAALLSHLSFTGADITGFQIGDEKVIDLGRGNNMHGNGRGPFDVGIAFGTPGVGHDDVNGTSFVIHADDGSLTLDDLALVDFGVRTTSVGQKNVTLAPAAPDAIDDTRTILEDTETVFTLLDNDTDADGDELRIVKVTQPEHGTVTIVADGKSVTYTPDLNYSDYSGPESFHYWLEDGNGGGDDAHVDVTVVAVADAPTLTVTTAAGADVNEILVTVTAAVTDLDGSEFLDRFEFTGLPAGATLVGATGGAYDPDGTGQSLSQTFKLQLAPNSSFDFTLGIEAVSEEKTNGSEASSFASVGVLIEAASSTQNATFEATKQSVWSQGDEYNFVDDRFLGFETSFSESSDGFVYGNIDGSIKAGFQSTLTFEGGSIDAEVPYEIGLDTTYNHVTDVLFIESSATLLNGGNFSVDGPEGNYKLDFIFDFYVAAAFGVDIEIDSWDIWSDEFGTNNRLNILDIASEDINFSYEFPYGLSLGLTWPDLDAGSIVNSLGNYSSSAQDTLLTLGLDVDDALFQILKLPNPFSINPSIGVAGISLELLDLDLYGLIDMYQDIQMSIASLTGTISFEDGYTQLFDFSDITLNNASSHDADMDGLVEFSLKLAPDASVTNSSGLAFSIGYSFDIGKGEAWYDIGVDSGSESFGPLYHTDGNLPLGKVELYDTTFDLDFDVETFNFAGNATAIGTAGAGVGALKMTGGSFDDRYIVTSVAQKVYEAANQGNDTVESSVSYSVAGQHVENLILTGNGNTKATGNGLDNVLVGNDGANYLNGGAGADRMNGRGGNDRYVVDNEGDTVTEMSAAGGIDRVDSRVSFTLGDNLEVLTLTGSAAINGTGNALSNIIIGNNAGNLIDGGAGADRMEGKGGNDRYVVDHAGDKVFELADGGNDVVDASVSYSLAGQYVETLRLTGSAAIDGTGNGQANSLIGNGADNKLSGLGGDDKLYGGLGADTLTGGAGADRFVFDSALGGGNVDAILDFSSADDAIYLDKAVFKQAAFGETILYDAASGHISYDADGAGAGEAVLFATVSAGTILTSADFIAF